MSRRNVNEDRDEIFRPSPAVSVVSQAPEEEIHPVNRHISLLFPENDPVATTQRAIVSTEDMMKQLTTCRFIGRGTKTLKRKILKQQHDTLGLMYILWDKERVARARIEQDIPGGIPVQHANHHQFQNAYDNPQNQANLQNQIQNYLDQQFPPPPNGAGNIVNPGPDIYHANAHNPVINVYGNGALPPFRNQGLQWGQDPNYHHQPFRNIQNPNYLPGAGYQGQRARL